MTRLLALVLVALLGVPAVAPAKAKRPAKRCEVVVFTKQGKTVRRCRQAPKPRPRPKPAPRPAGPKVVVVPAPAAPAAVPAAPAAAPAVVSGPGVPAAERTAPVTTPVAAPSPAASGPAPGPPPDGAVLPSAPLPAPVVCPNDSPWLVARAFDSGNGAFRMRIDDDCVRPGRLTVQLVNADLTEHNLWVRDVAGTVAPRAVLPSVDAETTEQTTLQLPAGTWRFYCSLRGHEAMQDDVTATG
jgi:plastocyanin